MKNPTSTASQRQPRSEGFTLMETVIAIGVLAVLLTGFIAVFTPAAQGIRRSISSQQADRLATTLERELVTLRTGQLNNSAKTGFEKAFDWIDKADGANEAIFVYQYRGDLSKAPRTDGTPEPMNNVSGQPGEKYTVQSMARRASDPEFTKDLKAIEGAVFYVKPTQLIYNSNEMILGTIGTIADPKDGTAVAAASNYKDAVIAFSAEFYSVPSKSATYIQGPEFSTRFTTAKRPVFSRNLAVRR